MNRPTIDPPLFVVALIARRAQRRLDREQLAEARRVGLERRHAAKLARPEAPGGARDGTKR